MTTANDLDAALAQAVEALQQYVTVARGVRGEFDPEQADLDPRVEQAAIALGLALGRFEDEFEAEIGFVPTVEPAWAGSHDEDADDEGPEGGSAPDGEGSLAADAFSMGMVVGADPTASGEQLDGVLGILDDAAGQLVDRLESEGYVVTRYFVARGEHAGGLEGFGDFDDFGDEDEDDDGGLDREEDQ